MKKKASLLLALLILSLSIPSWAEWAVRIRGRGQSGETYDDAYSIKQTNDGGYIVAGEIGDAHTEGDLWIIKLDSNGGIVWQKAIGSQDQYGNQVFDRAYCVQQTADGGYIVAAESDRFRYWVLKLNADGSIVWQKFYGGQFAGAKSIQQTSDGGYIVGGHGTGAGTSNSGGGDFGLIKLNPDGSVAWEKVYGAVNNDGKSTWEFLYSVQQTTDNGYIMSGTEQSFGIWNDVDFWLVKVDQQGNILWRKSYRGPSQEDDLSKCSEWQPDVRQTPDGGYIVAGMTRSFGAYGSDIWVLKLDGSGNVEWERRYAGTCSDTVRSICVTKYGGYILAGVTTDICGSYNRVRAWILKLDTDGFVEWDRTLKMDSWANSIEQTKDGGYIVAGWIKGLTYIGNDILVFKINSIGDIPGCDITRELNIASLLESSAIVEETSCSTRSKTSQVTEANGTSRTPVFEFFTLCMNANHQPVADAGDNLTITSDEVGTTTINGSASDVDQDDYLEYCWKKGEEILVDWTPVPENGVCPLTLASFPFTLGTHTLTLEVTDGQDFASDDMVLSIGNSSPNAVASGGGVYEIGTDLTLGGQVSDFDEDNLHYQWMKDTEILFSGSIEATVGGVDLPSHTLSSLNLGLGEHTITLQVDDGVSTPITRNIAVNVVDTTVPTISATANKTILWPPNHEMVDIVIQANATDNSGGPVILSAAVKSNEPEEGLGDGDTPFDWTKAFIDQATGIITLQLRAERGGRGSGREYTVTVTATDGSENKSYTDVKVIVTHDRRLK